MNSAGENPYIPPASDIEVVAPEKHSASLQSGERIPFEGYVSRSELTMSLRPRLSWVGVAALAIGALICFLSAPASFLNPFDRPGLLYVDALAEQLGLVGIGFVVLCGWHVFSACSNWLVVRREQNLIRQSPKLYDELVAGWFAKDYVHLRVGHTDQWMSSHGVGSFQVGERVLIIDWGTGAGGCTVLTRNLFASQGEFQRVAQQLHLWASKNTNVTQLAYLPSNFDVDGAEIDRPTSQQIIGEVSSKLSGKSAWNSLLSRIPHAVLRSSVPLHVFFLILAATALVLVQHWWVSLVWLAIVWLVIALASIIISLLPYAGLLRLGERTLIESRSVFTSEHVCIETTTGFFRIPVRDFVISRQDGEVFWLRHRDSQEENPVCKSDFSSPEMWMRTKGLFGLESSGS